MNPAKRVKFRDTTLDSSNKIVLKLINEINELYGKKGNSAYYGVFKEELRKVRISRSFLPKLTR
ncbi:hypothetical protein [Klebsiella pneumoniae]|uniref:hypothetical protein n=1 Tax=Klebsiella pneumoniae TaxID=573 RepID=UPI003D246909